MAGRADEHLHLVGVALACVAARRMFETPGEVFARLDAHILIDGVFAEFADDFRELHARRVAFDVPLEFDGARVEPVDGGRKAFPPEPVGVELGDCLGGLALVGLGCALVGQYVRPPCVAVHDFVGRVAGDARIFEVAVHDMVGQVRVRSGRGCDLWLPDCGVHGGRRAGAGRQ